MPAETVEQILQLALSPPPAGRSRWTTRLLADAVGRTSGRVSDILRAHGLNPHLVRTCKVSRDPAFAAKITGLPDNPAPAAILTGHELPPGWRVAAEQRLAGLHHQYGLERTA